MTRLRIPARDAPDLPEICVVTGATSGVRKRNTRFVFVPIMARLAIAFCGVIGLVIMAMMTKRAEVELPFTDQAWDRWRRSIAIFTILLVSSLISLVAGFLTDYLLQGFAIFVVVLVGAIAYHFAVVKKLGPSCREIDERFVTLDLPNDEAAQAIITCLSANTTEPRVLPPRDSYDERIDRELERL